MLDINKFNKIVVANWKLNGSQEFADNYFENLTQNFNNSETCGIICLPSTYLNAFKSKNKFLFLGAQDCSMYEKGAFTGEISAEMLKDNQCKFCIIGHSERRVRFYENNQDIKLKATNLINNEIIPIICVGETLEDKKARKTKEIIKNQIINSMPDNVNKNIIIIAYEPIWSIGTGITPEFDEIEEIHAFIKSDIKGFSNYKILYGGSVNSKNASKIFSLSGVDGALVGGASLDPYELNNILKA